MKRRHFLERAGGALLASNLGFASQPAEDQSQAGLGERIRHDFPALHELRAYLDTAFVGLLSRQVRAAHEAFLDQRMQFGPFPADKSILTIWRERAEKVRTKLAAFLGAKEKEVAFTYCTGCGSNIALKGIDWRQGDNAVIDDLEYSTDFHILNTLRKRGVELRIVRNKDGAITPGQFEAAADRKTRAFVVTHVSHLNGFRHDLKALAGIIHSYGGYLIVDSAQAVGGIKVDVKAEGIDLLSSIPYKFLTGPPGVGFLYIREDLIRRFEPDRIGWSSTNEFKSLETMESNPLPDHAKRFEYGTLNYEGIYALEAALDYLNQFGIEKIEEHNLALIAKLRQGLGQRGVTFYTPEGNRSPILSFLIEDEKSFGRHMKEQKIQITARRWEEGHVRLSPHFYNNEEDVEVFLQAFDRLSPS